MQTLFDIAPVFPDGFTYADNFLNEDEEQLLYLEIQKIGLHPFNFQGYTANRKVASFGYDYSFENRRLSKGKDIPSSFNFLVGKLSRSLSIPVDAFAELLITEYPPGSVINWHRDAPPFDIIAGISLLSDCSFRLRPHDKAKQNRAAVVSFPVRRRSLYVIKDLARTDWQHSITPVKELRYSITLRTVKGQILP